MRKDHNWAWYTAKVKHKTKGYTSTIEVWASDLITARKRATDNNPDYYILQIRKNEDYR